MFTGIVQATAKVVKIEEKTDFRTHTLRFTDDLLPGLIVGASVAHNGCCLTVTKIDNNLISFDLIKETLTRTNLGSLNVGDSVNLERAAKFGDEIGGHQMSGHILCTTKIISVVKTANNRQVWLALPEQLNKYVLYKGYVGIDGISLTIGDVKSDRFCVNLIPETLARTTLGEKGVGDTVNIEIDPQTQAIVETVERILAQKK